MLESFQILPGRSLVRIIYRYHPTFEEWQAMMKVVFSNEAFKPGFHFLFDKRAAGAAASNGYVEQVAKFYRDHQDVLGRCAIVASDPLSFGMSRMTEGYCIGDGVRAFTDVAAAEAWLSMGRAS